MLNSVPGFYPEEVLTLDMTGDLLNLFDLDAMEKIRVSISFLTTYHAYS